MKSQKFVVNTHPDRGVGIFENTKGRMREVLYIRHNVANPQGIAEGVCKLMNSGKYIFPID